MNKREFFPFRSSQNGPSRGFKIINPPLCHFLHFSNKKSFWSMSVQEAAQEGSILDEFQSNALDVLRLCHHLRHQKNQGHFKNCRLLPKISKMKDICCNFLRWAPFFQIINFGWSGKNFRDFQNSSEILVCMTFKLQNNEILHTHTHSCLELPRMVFVKWNATKTSLNPKLKCKIY